MMGVSFVGAVTAFDFAVSGGPYRLLAFLSGVLFFAGLSLLGIDLIGWYAKIR
jgi:hypothetical protein